MMSREEFLTALLEKIMPKIEEIAHYLKVTFGFLLMVSILLILMLMAMAF